HLQSIVPEGQLSKDFRARCFFCRCFFVGVLPVRLFRGVDLITSRTRPGGWSLGPPRAPGLYWYSESREAPPELVGVEWSTAGGGANGAADGAPPELALHAEAGGPSRFTARCTGRWRAHTGP